MMRTGVSRRAGWNPFWELDRMQAEVERFLDRPFGRQNDSYAPGFPAVNLWSGEDEVLVTAELPGVAPEAIDISVVDDTVTLAGSRSAEEAPAGAAFRHRERGHGRFARSFRLPFRIDASGVDARYANGVLEVTLRKAAEDRPREVPVLSA